MLHHLAIIRSTLARHTKISQAAGKVNLDSRSPEKGIVEDMIDDSRRGGNAEAAGDDSVRAGRRDSADPRLRKYSGFLVTTAASSGDSDEPGDKSEQLYTVDHGAALGTDDEAAWLGVLSQKEVIELGEAVGEGASLNGIEGQLKREL
jgi:hypothetical protein